MNSGRKLSNFILSDIKRKSRISISILLVFGSILAAMSILLNPNFSQFTIGLGVSLAFGPLIGFYAGNEIGWPLGFWIGLIGGLTVAPLVALLIGDSVAAYYASFLGPVSGAIIGRWTELDDKRKLKEDMDRISK